MSADNDKSIAPHPVLSEYYESEPDRRSRVDQMFDSSASHYDWINSVMSFGSGEWYRRRTLKAAGLQAGMKMLDVGAGTGVVSFLGQEIVGETGLVVALDPSKGMLGEARARGVKLASQGLGEALPFEDNTFDIVTMGYALRHVADLGRAFTEYLRVLKPGGRILVLEISKPRSGLGTSVLKLYMKGIVPLLTRIFRSSADAQELMRYYWDTIEYCVPPEVIIEALAQAGAEGADRRVMMGIFSEYAGLKPA